MSNGDTHSIWNPDSGITDLNGGLSKRSASEIPGIKAIWTEQQERLKGAKQLSDFTEKLSREWAIETGIIENLYDIDRGVTQTLIEHGFQPDLLSHGTTRKPQESLINILRDQKDALDGIFDFVKRNRSLSTSYIKKLHAALLRSQETTESLDAQKRYVEVPLTKGIWKTQQNYPVRDGVTYTYCPPEQVGSEMDRLIAMHVDQVEKSVPSEMQSAWLHHRFTQIHPFQDGNGRVARAIASLVLVKDGLFPLVVTRDDKIRYLKALEAADNGSLQPLIDLIVRSQITQLSKATAISETLRVEEGVQVMLDGLHRAADKVAADKLVSLKVVFDLAHEIEDDLKTRLEEIAPSVEDALRRVSESATAFMTKATPNTDYYYRAQIIDNAKHHIGYFADTRAYRSWVALNIRWSRRGQLVFTIHGFGKPFNGSLICAPFLEFKDTDEEGHTRAAFVPIVEEGFVFFYNEDQKQLLSRFLPWRENVLTVALKELADNL